MVKYIIVPKVFSVLILFGLLLGVYLLFIREGQLHWGATEQEIMRSMPGDGLVSNPTFVATRGITIHGTPQDIWPWVVQMGYGRAGYYGYDLAENVGSPRGIRSAESIIPELQTLGVGDPIPIFPGNTDMKIGGIEPDYFVTWGGIPSPSICTITWALYPIDPDHTRLVSRVIFQIEFNRPEAVPLLMTEFFDHLAVRKALLGVKGRVEGQIEPWAVQAAEVVCMFAGIFEFAAAVVLVLAGKRWKRAWAVALFAGFTLLFVLYAHAALWTTVLLEGIVLAGLVWAARYPPGRAPVVR